MSLTLPALKLLVAADPIRASRALAFALSEIRLDRGELAEQEVFEAVLEGLGPKAKFALREMFPRRSQLGCGTELRKIALPLWIVFRRADRETLPSGDLRKGLQDTGYTSDAEAFLGRCIQEGLLDAYSDQCRINSSLMSRGLATSPLLLP